MIKKALSLFFVFISTIVLSQSLTDSTTINITKTWSQEPSGYTYPISIRVPSGAVPQGGFPVCILLHGNGGNGPGMVMSFSNKLPCHILVAPSGYLNSWNISDESSEAPDVEVITELIDLLQSYSNIDSNRIRILGSSNGAALSNRLFIENKDPGVDIICAIVSQLSEAQYHNNNFYYPSGATGGSDPYDGYDIITTPITGRKYLSICNDNDPLIPYNGGASVGVNFLHAQDAAYIIAQSQGFSGSKITGTGSPVGSAGAIVYEYSYLSGQVVHLRGNAFHGTNITQTDYVTSFFNDCVVVDIDDDLLDDFNIFPNPTSSFIKIKRSLSDPINYEVFSITGQSLLKGILNSNNDEIDLSKLEKQTYFLRLENSFYKVLKTNK